MTRDTEELPATTGPEALDAAALAELEAAMTVLERSSFTQRVAAVLGHPVSVATSLLPEPVLDMVNRATLKALSVALKGAVRSLPDRAGAISSGRFHVALAALSGGAGGAFGFSSLPVELPVSTTIMLRSIADIARRNGEDLRDPDALLACLEVFALGGGNGAGPAGEGGYLALRAVLARSITDAARLAVARGMADDAAPALVKLLGQIASRFGAVVGQKAMSQAVPVIGAVTGAAINAAFTDHFQSLARAHFTVRRLERRFGAAAVRAAFDHLRRRLRPDASGASGPRWPGAAPVTIELQPEA